MSAYEKGYWAGRAESEAGCTPLHPMSRACFPMDWRRGYKVGYSDGKAGASAAA